MPEPSAPERPEAWQTNATGPFLTVGQVHVFALGGERFLSQAPDQEREIGGLERARMLAHELAS